MLDVHTGEVLALANWPTYNPNDRSRLTGEQLRNRVMTDTFEPGSTLKPFTVALALDKGLVKPTTPVRHGQRPLHDRRPHRSATRTRTASSTSRTIIQKSSNIGTTKISELLSAAGDVGDVHHGRLRPGAALRLPRRRGRPRASIQIVAADRAKANMSFGQGISMSLLQLAHAWLIFARDKLIEMIALWYLEAGKYDVMPIDSRGTARLARSARK